MRLKEKYTVRLTSDERKMLFEINVDRFEIHYTPKHGSWLNMAEIELSHLNRQCLDRRIDERSVMTTEVEAWTNAEMMKK